MCTKSPTSAEHRALLTRGQHGMPHVSLTSTHSSLILCLVISHLLSEPGRKGTQWDRQALNPAVQETFALMKHVSGRNLAEEASFLQTRCLLLVPHLEMMQKVWGHVSICFCLLGKCFSSHWCSGGAAQSCSSCCVLSPWLVRYKGWGIGGGELPGLLIPEGSSTTWTIHNINTSIQAFPLLYHCQMEEEEQGNISQMG